MSLTTTQLALTKLYLAAFNRAPEKGGFDYWSSQLAAGKSFDDVVKTVFSLDIVKAIYPDAMSNSDFLTAIYNNIFGKTPDSDGLAYWLSQLNGGRDRSSLVLTMIDAGLGTPDGTPGKAFVVDRYNVSQNAIEQQLATGNDIGVDRLTKLLQTVTADSTTVTTAESKLAIYALDNTAPTLTGAQPAAGTATASTTDKIVLTFSETVTAGSGNIVVTSSAGDTRTIAATDTSQVTFQGNVVTIKPPSVFATGTHYSVQIGGNAIKDLADNVYSGVGTTKAYEFNVPVTSINLAKLDGSNGFRIDGILPKTSYSTDPALSLAAAGDVNGDGYDDIVIGTGLVNYSYGQSAVVFGKAGGFSGSMTLSSLNGSNGFRLDSSNMYQVGVSVGGGGDFNGDGYADVIAGANWAAPNGNFSGSSYVTFGKATGFTSLSSIASAGMRIDGDASNIHSGFSVGSAGDVNGDGVDDILIGSYGKNSYTGAAYVVFGNKAGLPANLNLSSLDGSNGYRLEPGVQAFIEVGYSVSKAGDVNGDGYDDLIIGSGSIGGIYVAFGKASGFAAVQNLSKLDGSNGFALTSFSGNDYAGYSVHGAGDINGDGFADVVIGAPARNVLGSYGAGSAYVVFGKASGMPSTFNLTTLSGADGFRIDGITLGDNVGISVSGAGDVNGDGYDDLIIGANHASTDGKDAGTAYLIYGKATGFPAAINLADLDSTVGLRIGGGSAGDDIGIAVSAAGDVNGDGYADLLVGADNTDYNGAGTGSSYVVFGSNLTGAAAFQGTSGNDTLTGTAAAERFIGGTGNDMMIGGGGADVFYGGAGNDTIVVSDLNFLHIDGGSGADTLKLSGANMNFNLATLRGRISDIEIIDLTGAGNNTLTLTARDLAHLSDSTNTLTIEGNTGDVVNIGIGTLDNGAFWVDSGIVNGHHMYAQGNSVILVGLALTVI
jgi:methionine-rich copper-binding protein CopC